MGVRGLGACLGLDGAEERSLVGARQRLDLAGLDDMEGGDGVDGGEAGQRLGVDLLDVGFEEQVRRRRERGVIAHLVERGRELAARTAPVSVPVDHDRLGLLSLKDLGETLRRCDRLDSKGARGNAGEGGQRAGESTSCLPADRGKLEHCNEAKTKAHQ